MDNYPISYDVATSKGSATCTGRRLIDSPDAYIELKTGHTYLVKSGYKVYNMEADYDNGIVAMSGNGNA